MKRVLLVSLSALALSLALATAAFAATGVTGTVKDINTGAVISGATVTDGVVSATTGSGGVYALASALGSHTLSASKSGYLKTYQVCTVPAGSAAKVDWFLTPSYPAKPVPAKSVTVLAWNDLGMHCDQDSYKYFMVLPPYNTLHAQVFGPEDATGYTITYSFAKKKDSTLHTDFWTYAPSFGFNLPKNVGLTGNGLSGTMKLENAARGLYTATGIPVTPYDDDGTWDPYGAATLTVKNSAGTVVATTNVVTPVSTEMSCSTCHGTTNPAVDILSKHDDSNGTTLLADANAGHPHACAECHSDNALGMAGKPGVPSLSYAMHKFHDGKVASGTAGCYTCHPGPKTECLRGIMARAGKGCVDCHGDVNKVWTSIASGRKPWLDEPRCDQCHDASRAENAGTLYRNSVLNNSVAGDMNGKIYCEACHNGTHAESTTKNPADAVISQTYQGDNYWIYNCQVCHKGNDSETTFRGQAMHAGGGVPNPDPNPNPDPDPNPSPNGTDRPIYRFRNLRSGFYLWSADSAEKATIIETLSTTWKYEGVAYQVNTANALNQSPLWRFRNLAGGFYLYTANPAEKANIIANLASSWRYEGPAYNVSTDQSGAPVWRFRNRGNGTYLYSADPSEKANIVANLSATWKLEGPAFYLAP